MRTREAVLVAVVVVVGYSLYGVVFAVGANVAAAPGPELDPGPVASTEGGDSGPVLSFESVGERRGQVGRERVFRLGAVEREVTDAVGSLGVHAIRLRGPGP